MPEVRKRVLYCSYLLTVVAATGRIIGVIYFFSSERMPYHLAWIGMSFQEIKDFNPNLALWMGGSVNTVGTFMVGFGTLAMGIVLGA